VKVSVRVSDTAMHDTIRLPQDVGPPANGDTRGVPDLSQMRAEVADYAAMRSRLDDHDTRATGCWGLVARWPASRTVTSPCLVLASSMTSRMRPAFCAGSVYPSISFLSF
jgi:hypothetical protein